MKPNILYLFFICFLLGSCNGQSNKNFETIPATAFAKKIKTTQNPQILDVRSPEEFANEHIDKAINVNWNGVDFEGKVSSYEKSKPVFVYCMSGGRSAKASEKLNEMGFTQVFNLDGGILKWNAAGLDKPSDKIIGICPQEYTELLKTDKKVLVSFYAEWCEPCIKMKPFILKMQSEMADTVTIIRLNADENKTIMKELKVDELPVFLLYKNNEIIWKHSGFISEEDLKKQL